jgi:arabinofuranan 3-O-arabinosyltransferase
VTTVARRPAPITTEAPAAPPSARRRRVLGYSLLAALAYIPPLLTAWGKVAADTKQYLYLDPTRLLERAPSMWDPNIGLGTVTHQNIGYVFPMGPYYWVMENVGFPSWVAQRIWLGSLVFFAGLGVLYLLRTIDMRGPGAVVAALAYMLSPYSLHYAARISVILLPWAGLGWMLGLMIRALRKGGWRYPAAFAIVVQIVGSVNATALVFAFVAPLLWVSYAVWIAREVDWRRAALTLARIGVLTLGASLWWISGLWADGSYGINILKYTETVKTVATAGVAPEVLRGLGHWFFYGGDKLGNWIEASVHYTQGRPLIIASYAVPTLALLAAAFIRWRHRFYFAVLMVIGVAIAVGAHPFDDPSPFGALLKAFADSSTAGLALRSVGRAVPLVALGAAVLLGAGVSAFARWLDRCNLHRYALATVGLVGVIVIAALPALWNGDYYGKNLQRPEEIPAYWKKAIAAVDAGSHDTRVLEVPGSDFASYRWGNTVDPITPGLMDRPYVARELIPYGTPETNDLLNALDGRVQEGLLDPNAIAPIARLMSAGDILVRNDLQVDRYNLVRPKQMELLLNPPPRGIGPPTGYGTSLGPPLDFPLLDEKTLALPAGTPDPPPVVVYPVDGAPSIVRAQPAVAPLVVAGGGDGLVDIAGLGMLDGNGIVQYSASYAGHPAELRKEAGTDGAVLVVTDSNRRRARRWSTVRENVGYTERPGEKPLVRDPSDARLDVFPGAGDDAYTVTEQRGATVEASAYGNNVSYTPEDRPARAMDGDLRTAWKVGAFGAVEGEHIRVALDRPVTADHINLVQPLYGDRNRWITEATLRFDDGHEITTNLGDESRTDAGQTVTFPRRTVKSFDIKADETNLGKRATYSGVSGVGFSEIRIRDQALDAQDVRVEEVTRMPVDLTRDVGADSLDHRLVYSTSRSRTVLVPPRFSEDERNLTRAFDVPAGREFGLAGTARISTAAPDELVDQLVGVPGAGAGGVTARSSARLPGDVQARASSAIDGNPSTAWTTPFATPAGPWVDIDAGQPVTFDHLDLQVVADGRHSVPTHLRIDADGQTRTVDLPAIADQSGDNATTPVTVSFDPVTARNVRVTVESVREVKTREYYSNTPIVTPVALAELGIPGVQRPPLGESLVGACRDDLLTVDGAPVPVRVTGSVADASAGRPLSAERCDPASGAATSSPLPLDRGQHVLRSALGVDTGLDLDGIVLGSEAGGAPLALGPGGAVPPADAAGGGAPKVETISSGRTSMKLRVTGADIPFWLVLGESHNRGWVASVDGHDLGEGKLVNGYANGWRIDPKDGRTVDVTLTWTPQRTVWMAFAISGATMLLCTALALGLLTRRRRAMAAQPAEAAGSFDEPPAFRWPIAAAGTRPRGLVIAATAIGAGLVAAVLIKPLPGMLVGLFVLAALLRARWRVVLAIGAPVALGLAALYVLLEQTLNEYPPVFEWPTFFDRVHVLGSLAVALLAADALVEVVRTRRRRPDDPPPSGEARGDR